MKKIITIMGLVLLSACGGSSLLTTPDGSGTGTLTITALHHLSDGSGLPAGATKTFSNNEGYQITLTEGEIGWRSLRLISAGSDPSCIAGRDVTVNLGTADNLLAADLTNVSLVSNQEIQAVNYCQYQIILGAASTPAGLVMRNHALPTDPGAPAAPATVTYHFQGTWTKGATAGSFNFERTDAITLSGTFRVEEGGSEINHPLHFHTGETHADVGFEIHYNTLFSGVDFSSQTDTEEQNALNSNFSESIHQEIVAD